MEVKEAADLLDNLVGMVEDSHEADYDTALKMGIEALTAQPEPKCADGCIYGWGSTECEHCVVPSAQPSLDEWCYTCSEYDAEQNCCPRWNRVIRHTLEDAQPERKKDIIQTFHDYQIEWLTNHYDIELEPQLEELIVRFLHDTASMYMLEMERRTDETD